MIISAWEKLQDKFPEIILNNHNYNNIVKNILLSPNNLLLYCSYGFPLDLIIDIILQRKFNKKILNGTYNKQTKYIRKNKVRKYKNYKD